MIVLVTADWARVTCASRQIHGRSFDDRIMMLVPRPCCRWPPHAQFLEVYRRAAEPTNCRVCDSGLSIGLICSADSVSPSIQVRPTLPQVIRVPEAFVFQEGAKVTDDLVAGKLLGDGVQGQVYVLKRPDGSSTDQLLKARFLSCVELPG